MAGNKSFQQALSICHDDEFSSSFRVQKKKRRKAAAASSRTTPLSRTLSAMVLTEEELEQNRFPRPGDFPGMAVIPGKRTGICVRCKEPVTSEEPCRFHVAVRREYSAVGDWRYPCCGGHLGSTGCRSDKGHIGERSPGHTEDGFVQTGQGSSTGSPPVFALATIKVYTEAGVEPARILVLDDRCKVQLDTLIRPSANVVNYDTKNSGLKAKDLQRATLTLGEVQKILTARIPSDAVIVGCGLQQDLTALRLVHSVVVDGAILYPSAAESKDGDQTGQSGLGNDNFTRTIRWMGLLAWETVRSTSDFRFARPTPF